ncbi:M14 family metallopeptidase [Myxococcus landrumensis]|uniref:M14 family metallopeptidase n=1 Tax=Myxococcus landrumensis TaxID=2813577 RepID=A0ABX7MX72_9BACT|nr:M14 family metallopeptidase [Myxococcus landrumus]QSQ10991.1 M14 family metallopeptidase [Myxococcus landrumus]
MLLATALSLALTQAPLPLTTVSEQSGWTRTGRYSEVEALCRAFPKAFPGKVRCDTFGTTPEGRPMLALIASADGTLTPAANAKKSRPVVFFQGGIHAGEIDGKDAGFALLRDLLSGKTLPGILKNVTAVFVPVFNVDGHERFGPNNRPNQVGPEEMGWRTTGQNFNLNRDYVKADAPEMVALLRYLNTWDALIYADLHVTDGAKFEPDVAIAIEPLQSGPAPLRTVGVKLMKELLQELETQGHQPLDFYPSFREDDDPKSGFAYGVPSPRFSHAYAASHRRFGVLVETHSWKPYAQRVKATRNVVASLLRMAARDGAAMLTAVKAADAEAQAGKVRDVVLAWKNTAQSRPINFRGYAYERGTSEVSGQTWIRYDDSKPEVWTVPYFDTVEPALTVSLPSGGYLVPPAHAAWVSQKLTTHGLSFQRLSRPTPTSDVEVFRATESKWSASSNEGHQTLSVKGAWEKQSQALPAGTLYVPVAQPGVELVAHMFEPSGPDSLLSWGFFNAHFEQKEYIEDYVLEPFARELLAKDAGVKAEWDAKLKDPAFAKDARARLRFFYERHPARDTQLRVYPVLRTATAPTGLSAGR